MVNKKILAMLLAGGQGSRLKDLTKHIAKPAISFGGKYRIIDFSLSNCINSDIDTVGVLTQYKPLLLNAYLSNGAAWDLDTANGGLHILPPYYTEAGGNWYEGTADAIYRNIDFIDGYHPTYVIILSGDHLYKMDYRDMLKFHEEKQADLTVSVTQVPIKEASRFGILNTNGDYEIYEFEEKPKFPKSNYASMGIYIFNWPVLKKSLIEDHSNKYSHNDFGKDIIPMLLNENKKLYAFEFKEYWKDCGTLDCYYDEQMALLEDKPDFNIFSKFPVIHSNTSISRPHYIAINARIKQSLIANVSYIGGNVTHSVISNNAYVGSGAIVADSILLPGSKVMDNAVVKYGIVGENSIIHRNSSFVGTKENIKIIGDLKHYRSKRKDLSK